MTSEQGRQWLRIASLDEFGEARKLVREIADFSVLLQRIGSDVVALLNVCTHLGHPLDGGRVMAGQIICPFHGACFDLRTGAAVSGPAVLPLHCFPVKLEGTEIFIDLERRPMAPFGRPYTL